VIGPQGIDDDEHHAARRAGFDVSNDGRLDGDGLLGRVAGRQRGRGEKERKEQTSPERLKCTHDEARPPSDSTDADERQPSIGFASVSRRRRADLMKRTADPILDTPLVCSCKDESTPGSPRLRVVDYNPGAAH
jgi:hypothetical protein